MISIVTDTSVGYSRAEAESRGVRLVSLAYLVSGIARSEQPRGENGNYMNVMRGKLVKTSQPTPLAFSKIFDELTAPDGEVLCITLSSSLSGTYASAVKAAEPYGKRVRVMDSGTVCGGLHLLVDEAVNMVVGGMKLSEICDNLVEIKNKVDTFFSVDSLDSLRKGGRLIISKATNTTLNTRPILACCDNIKFIKNVRGIKPRVDALVSFVPDSARRIFLMATPGTDTSRLESALSARFPHIKIHLRDCGPVIAVHVGEGAIGVAYISK